MVICIIALVILAFLGIFSAKYRRWAKEAFGCVKRMATLRPCETGFDDKVKAKITTVLMSKNEGLAKFTHKHFKALSWVFVALFVFSICYSAYTAYNLVVFGTCDPANPSDCVFNPGGDPNKVVCPYQSLNPAASIASIGGFSNILSANATGKPAVYFFGTTWCPHCGWEKPIFDNVTAKFSGYIDVKDTEIDITQPPVEMAIFKHYSTEGSIPLIVIGGKYFRIGSGEFQGEQAETNTLTALLCKVTNNPISDCNSTEVAQLEQTI